MEKKILVVDDDESVIDLIKGILPLPKYMVIEADSEAKALETLNRDLPDAAVIDVHLTKMKDMQGLELCRRIKTNLRTQHIPVIMISGDNRDESLILMSFAVDAVDFMSKPFGATQFLARLEKRLEETSPLKWVLEKGRFVKAGNICLDIESRKVFFKGRELTQLSPTQASLLCVFIGQPNTIFRKETLYSKAWPMRSKPYKDLRLVDKTIERLRNRLGPKASQLLETVPSAGYRLDLGTLKEAADRVYLKK